MEDGKFLPKSIVYAVCVCVCVYMYVCMYVYIHIHVGWKDDTTSSVSEILLALMETTAKGPVVAISVSIHENFSWQLHVQGR